MKYSAMATVCSTTLFFAACTTEKSNVKPPSGDDQIQEKPMEGETGQFRGFTPINTALRQRLMKPNSNFFLGRYVGETPSMLPFVPEGLTALLGFFKGDGLNAGYRNSKPNSVNLVLWQVAFKGFAEDISKICDASLIPEPLPRPTPGEYGIEIEPDILYPDFNETFSKKISTLCSWPSAESRSSENLEKIWLAIMAYDAPHEEFVVWKDMLQNDNLKNKTPLQAIQLATFTVMFHPYFLLKK